MLAAADDLRFEEAGRIRDELKELRRDLDGMRRAPEGDRSDAGGLEDSR